jgi:hypothetical protein
MSVSSACYYPQAAAAAAAAARRRGVAGGGGRRGGEACNTRHGTDRDSDSELEVVDHDTGSYRGPLLAMTARSRSLSRSQPPSHGVSAQPPGAGRIMMLKVSAAVPSAPAAACTDTLETASPSHS